MTLDNTRRPYQSVSSAAPQLNTFNPWSRSRRMAPKRKYSDKPCPRFTTTGVSLSSRSALSHVQFLPLPT